MPHIAAAARVRNRSWGLDDVLVRFLRYACWNVVSIGLARCLNMVAMLVASRILGPEEYGRLGVVQSTVAMLCTFAGFGLGLTATRFVARYRRSNPARAAEIISGLQGLSIVGGLSIAALTTLGGPWLAKHVLSNADLGIVLQIASTLVVLNALSGVQQGVFAGLEAVRSAALIQVVGGALLLIGMYCGARFGGVLGCVVAQVAVLTTQILVTEVLLRRIARKSTIRIGLPRLRPTSAFPELLAFGLPAALSAILVTPVEWIVSVMLVNQPNGFAQMGLYSAARQWTTPALMIPAVVGQAILPLLGERQAAGDHRAASRLLVAATLLNAAAVAPLVALGLLFSSSMLGVSGSEFVRGEATLHLLILAAALYAVETPAGVLLAGQGWIWSAFVINLGCAICLLVAVECYVQSGATGVAGARALTYVIQGVWTFAVAWRMLRAVVRPATA